MLKNAYLLAKIGADTAENERNFAEYLPRIGNGGRCRGLAANGHLAGLARGWNDRGRGFDRGRGSARALSGRGLWDCNMKVN